MPEAAPVRRFRTAVSRTRYATGLTLRRRDTKLVIAGVTAAYFFVYLWAIGHLAPGFGGFEVVVVENPLTEFFQPGLGPLVFTTVAKVSLGPVSYLFSLNTVIGLALAVLVGLNLGLTYLAWVQPKACGLGQSSSGFFASIPAVLSGTACCGPVVLIVLGIQASGVLITAFQFLLPVAFVLLLGTLVLVGRQVDPQRI